MNHHPGELKNGKPSSKVCMELHTFVNKVPQSGVDLSTVKTEYYAIVEVERSRIILKWS